MPLLKKYVDTVLEDIAKNAAGIKEIEFDLGVEVAGQYISVNDKSLNRIRFTININSEGVNNA